MKIILKIDKAIRSFLCLFIKVIRPFLGSYNVCIYPESCGNFAIKSLKEKPLYRALPLVILRLLSCNPISWLIYKIHSHKY